MAIYAKMKKESDGTTLTIYKNQLTTKQIQMLIHRLDPLVRYVDHAANTLYWSSDPEQSDTLVAVALQISKEFGFKIVDEVLSGMETVYIGDELDFEFIDPAADLLQLLIENMRLRYPTQMTTIANRVVENMIENCGDDINKLKQLRDGPVLKLLGQLMNYSSYPLMVQDVIGPLEELREAAFLLKKQIEKGRFTVEIDEDLLARMGFKKI
jgi:acyl carrier protein